VTSEDKDRKPIVIKKYANRRLYNTATSSYVTLDHLARLVQEDVDFVVYDAKTGEDITRSVLTLIIVEAESKGENLLPISFLRQLIAFYGDSMRWMVPNYLEHMVETFSQNQGRMRDAMEGAMGNFFSVNNLEEMRKQNLAFFEQAMRMWSPFQAGDGQGPAPGTTVKAEAAPAAPAPQGAAARDDLERLKTEVASLKAELASLSKPGEAAGEKPAKTTPAPANAATKPAEAPAAEKPKPSVAPAAGAPSAAKRG